MQVTYRPYKRACRFSFWVFDNAQTFTVDAFANKLLSTVHARNFNGYNHIGVIVRMVEYACIERDSKNAWNARSAKPVISLE
jgi:hypothetical protein